MSIKDINDILSEDIKKIDSTLTKNIIRLGPTKTRFVTNIVVTGPAEVEERSSAQYICTAYYTDGTNEQVQADLWVENTIYATIDEDGLLTTLDVPNQDIPIIVSASYKGFTNSQPVSIRNVVLLTHIEITGPLTVEERGGDQYLCTAYYDNGNDAPVTPTWSDNSAYGNIGTDGYLTTLETPNQNEPCTISASYGGKTDDFAMTITNVIVLNSIEIEGPTEVNEDSTAQYNCRAYYDDGTSPLVTPAWSDNSPYASLDVNGLMTTLTVPQVDQSCSVTANFGGKVDSLPMTIKNVKVLTSLTIAGPTEVNEDSSAEYTLTAHYADDPDELVNAQSWSVAPGTYASINASGQLTTASVPQGDQAIIITANYGGQSDTHNVTIKNIKIIDYIEIIGSPNVNERSTAQYTAWVTYLDDPSENITSIVDWSDDSPYGSLNSSGLLTTYDVEGVNRACEIMALYPGKFARATDQGEVRGATGDDLIPIDTSKTYYAEVYTRCQSVDSVLLKNNCYAGLQFYDINKTSLGYRWCVASHYQFTSVGQIFHKINSSITGEGSAWSEFWVGTKYVRILNTLNYLCTGNGTAITDVLFWRLAEVATPMDHLNVNPGFDQGQLGWYPNSTYTIESSSQGSIDTIDITINNTVDITRIEISGANDVDERSGSQYTATAYKDNGTTENVTSSAIWKEDSVYATINSSGYLTTLETPNQDESCNITSVYPGKVLNCAGRVNFEHSDFIPINTSNTYYMESAYRCKTIDSVLGYNRLYIGVRCYDSSFITLFNSYCIASNLQITSVQANAQILSREMTGEGLLSTNFREGTAYIRVVALVNYLADPASSPDTDVLMMKFTNNASKDVNLLANGTFYQDKEHWNNYNTNDPLTTGEIQSVTQGNMDLFSMTIKNVVALDHITITGATEVDENSTAQYKNTAYYDDSSTANVTNSTTWGENSAYASISSTGLLTTTAVPSDQGAQITANYGGKGDTQNITIKNVALIPAGLIVPFDSNVVPSGWTRFAISGSAYLRGAGSGISPNVYTGSNALGAKTSTTDGSHYGGTFMAGYGTATSGGGGGAPNDSGYTNGNHSHNLSTGLNYYESYVETNFIKANTALAEFPANAVVFTNTAISPVPSELIKPFTDEKMLKSPEPNSLITPAESNSKITGTVALTSAGYHDHHDMRWVYDGDNTTQAYGAWNPTHAHSNSASLITNSFLHNIFYLKAWTKATALFPCASNMIGMYESATAPEGWKICDGTNGTPDLRSCFIKTSSDANVGTRINNAAGKITVTLRTLNDSWTHYHYNYWYGWVRAYSGRHHGYESFAHTHDFTFDLTSLPRTYGLYFIMKD